MIYLSAGHHYNPNGADPGAMATHNGKEYKEADLTKELRDLIAKELKEMGASFILDSDAETLPQYLKRIKPGSGSVVCDLHFNSAVQAATGVEVIVKAGADFHSRKLADEVCNAVVTSCKLFNRGVKTEAQTHRGRLGVLNTAAGISVLPEICFISNQHDLDKYHAGKGVLAMKMAKLLKKYDELFR